MRPLWMAVVAVACASGQQPAAVDAKASPSEVLDAGAELSALADTAADAGVPDIADAEPCAGGKSGVPNCTGAKYDPATPDGSDNHPCHHTCLYSTTYGRSPDALASNWGEPQPPTPSDTAAPADHIAIDLAAGKVVWTLPYLGKTYKLTFKIISTDQP